MGFFNQLFGEKDFESGDIPDTMPWDTRPSIYEHICAHINPDQFGLIEAGYVLPDEARINEGSELRWAAGALDGVLTHHGGNGNAQEQVQKTVTLLLNYCDQPTAANKYALYQHILNESIVSMIDAVIESLLNEQKLNHERLYELASSFATEAPDRETVKFGIAILGLYQVAENTLLFQILGRHDEFTLYCSVALGNIAEESELALWELARNVDGWGRIHVVERLAETENSEIKNWLLREGFRNSILNEYLAFTCATTGGLCAALSEPYVDRELLTSAGELIEALINGGPAEDMDDYDDGAIVVELFLQQLETAIERLTDFLHVSSIQQFLKNEEADWGSRSERGWTAQRRQELLTICNQNLDRPEWSDRVQRGLESLYEQDFYAANQVARVLEMPTWDYHWKRLQELPHDSGRWFNLMLVCDESQISQVLEFAEQSLDLASIASGADDALGIGPEYEQHSCLDFILQELRRFPGHGSVLIEAGLKSPVVRNRNIAVAALATWGEAAQSFAPLKQAAEVEPSESLRHNIQKILKGEPPEE
ncbi:hypothetical protein [uncultured Gimesia sp.]|uniref:hypothetical protein n=1 Tax=uncultured Gimesia sp. TaxID=1678688 RepID=UPI0030DA035D|tara:strand:- start:108605 stop:110224 length:1620 start_codon:yes stop_codon:yes gene_type:complete